MKAIIVDADPILIDVLSRIVSNYDDNLCIDATFTDPDEALYYLQHNDVDIAFLDIKLPAMNGLTLGKAIRKFSDSIAIIFTTTHPEYAVEAFKVYAQGYVLKPYIQQDVFLALDNAKRIISNKNHISAITFGNFDIFHNGKVIHFSRSKSKELLALLIDRCGGEVTLNEVIETLWCDSPHDDSVRQLARKIVSSLKKDLEYYGIKDICTFNYGAYSVNPDKLYCDSFNLLSGDKTASDAFTGEYMTQYSWAECSVPRLIAAKNNL
ncbi:MAG: response regulator [Clostridia bacterium]|nr:response regulator [Clostridia bacterium]